MKERITILRKSLGLTMEKFGERLGISRDAVNNLEHGRAKIKEHSQGLLLNNPCAPIII